MTLLERWKDYNMPRQDIRDQMTKEQLNRFFESLKQTIQKNQFTGHKSKFPIKNKLVSSSTHTRTRTHTHA